MRPQFGYGRLGIGCGILCGMLCGILRWTPSDELYGENGIYKRAGNPSCLVFYHYRISSLFPVFTIRTREQVN